MRTWAVVPWLVVAGVATAAETKSVPVAPPVTPEVRIEHRHENIGATLAPAALPDGASAVAGWVGVPELGVAYRQGLSFAELGARVRFDYLRLATTAELTARRLVWTDGTWAVAPELGVGVTGNPGSRYFDARNTRGWYLRLAPAAVVTRRLVETVSAVGLVDITYDQGLSSSAYWRLKPLVGAGAEVYIGEDLSLSLLGQVGVDVFRGANRLTEARLGYGARLGLGVRLF